MAEADWWASDDQRWMMLALKQRVSERKLRLFACACCRRVRSFDRRVIGTLEGYADGLVKRKEAMAAVKAAIARGGICAYCQELFWRKGCHYGADITAAFCVDNSVGTVLLRCIFGDPFRAAPAVDPAWLVWNDGTAARLARDAYDRRRFPPGTLDPKRLALLADALEDAGCAGAELLGHLRGPGPHVRGCWAVDLLLGKE